MKIQAEKFRDFLIKTSLNGKILTMVLNFKEDAVKVAVTTTNVAFVSGVLKKTAFQEYEAIGEVGIKNCAVFSSLLKRYGNKLIELKIEENKLSIVSETGSTFFVLCDKDMVENHAEEGVMDVAEAKMDGGFEILVDKLVSIKQAADIIKATNIIFKVKDKKLFLNVESEGGDKITETLDVDYKDVKSKYGALLHDIIVVASGKVIVSLNDDFPIRIKETTEDYILKYILAPLVGEK